MNQETLDKINVIKGGMTTLRPMLEMCGVTDYPTVDEILAMAAEQSDNEQEQLMFLKGYMKGTGKVMGNIGNINRATQKTTRSQSQGLLAKLLSF